MLPGNNITERQNRGSSLKRGLFVDILAGSGRHQFLKESSKRRITAFLGAFAGIAKDSAVTFAGVRVEIDIARNRFFDTPLEMFHGEGQSRPASFADMIEKIEIIAGELVVAHHPDRFQFGIMQEIFETEPGFAIRALFDFIVGHDLPFWSIYILIGRFMEKYKGSQISGGLG